MKDFVARHGTCDIRFDLLHFRPEISWLVPPSPPKYGAEVVILWAGRPSRLLLLFAKIGKLALSLFRSFVSSPVISRCGEIRN